MAEGEPPNRGERRVHVYCSFKFSVDSNVFKKKKKTCWENRTKIQSKNKTLGLLEALGSSLSFVMNSELNNVHSNNDSDSVATYLV